MSNRPPVFDEKTQNYVAPPDSDDSDFNKRDPANQKDDEEFFSDKKRDELLKKHEMGQYWY